MEVGVKKRLVFSMSQQRKLSERRIYEVYSLPLVIFFSVSLSQAKENQWKKITLKRIMGEGKVSFVIKKYTKV